MTERNKKQHEHKTKVGLIPEDWRATTIGKIAKVTTGGTPSRANKSYWNGKIPWVATGHIDFNLIDSPTEYITENGVKNSSAKPYPVGTLLIAMFGQGVTRGKVAILGIRAAFNQACSAIVPQNGDCTKYLFYWLAYRYQHVRRMGQVGTQSNLNASIIKSIPIPLPPLPEQKKIAAILGKWDEGIERLEHLIAAKKELKKGLMQQLLTGKKRFKEFVKFHEIQHHHYFDIPVDWNYASIAEVAHEVTSRHDGSEVIVLSCSKYDGMVNSLDYFGKKVYSDNTSNYKIVKRGQFAYPSNHIEEGSIGLLRHISKGIVSPIYTVFETSKKVEPEYLYALFKTELYHHIFSVNTNASVDRRGSLRWREFANIFVPVPSLPEQRKIASVLNEADKEIKLLSDKLEALKHQKKGLMQKLLTGKVRVKL